MKSIWTAAEMPPAVERLRQAGLDWPLGELLALRGVADPEAARGFLAPRLSDLVGRPPLPGVPELAARLAGIAAAGGRVTVVGDYDVDGVSSAAILSASLEALGAQVETLLPRRDGAGYGLQPEHVRRAHQSGADLLVAVDSGTSARAAHREAARLGIQLAVVDHHLPDAEAPGTEILLVNPRVAAGSEEQRELSAAGLALLVAARLFAEAGREVPWEGLLRIAALGTVADVAPLVGDNRILVALGLEAMGRTRSPGLRALFERSGIELPLRASDIAFRIAPRLNAAGRLAAADEAYEILVTRDSRRAGELATLLENRNSERQRIERVIVEQASGLARGNETERVFLAWSPDWHRGVVGIAAARMARKLNRPAILLAVEGETATGSGRSANGFDLHALLLPYAERMLSFGGHAQAVGLTVAVAALEPLRDDLERAARSAVGPAGPDELRYDFELAVDAVDDQLLGRIEQLEPFGAGNPEPVFLLSALECRGSPREFGRGHLEIAVSDGSSPPLAAVVWNWGERDRELLRGQFDLLAAVERDRRKAVRLRVVDLRPATSRGCD